MSFEKKTWEDRLAEFPKRRTLTKSDNSTEVVEVSRNEGDIFQEGDKFSATNMNDLEQRIEDAIEEVTLASAVVPGSMMMFGGSNAPSGWLLCNGQAVSRTTYADLFTAIGTTWGEGDGETTFNVPDMREAAPVGVGTTSRTIPTHDTYVLGQFKDDQMQTHTHTVPSAYGSRTAYRSDTAYDTELSVVAYTPTTSAPSGRNGSVTRGKRIGVNYIIKY